MGPLDALAECSLGFGDLLGAPAGPRQRAHIGQESGRTAPEAPRGPKHPPDARRRPKESTPKKLSKCRNKQM
eukprot:963636-Pyramimonas_sp.AAC.1